jgi:hypothetical protein
VLSVEGETDDNWDEDFEEGISISKIAALDRDSSSGTSDEEGKDDEEDDTFHDANAETIRPSHLIPPAVRPKPLESIVEDYSDLVVGAEVENAFETRVAQLKLQNSIKKRILHPKDISESFAVNSPSSSVKILSSSAKASTSASASPSAQLLDKTNAPVAGPSNLRRSQTASAIERYTETDSEDCSDVFGSLKNTIVESGAIANPRQGLYLTRFRNRVPPA